jgi:hypothetical protein
MWKGNGEDRESTESHSQLSLPAWLYENMKRLPDPYATLTKVSTVNAPDGNWVGAHERMNVFVSMGRDCAYDAPVSACTPKLSQATGERAW